jgi:hypothetical protein
MRVLFLLPALLGIPSFAALIDIQFPHLLLPLRSWAPDTAFPTENEAYVTYSVRILQAHPQPLQQHPF